jgi:tyrosyl-tRNA synthetase
VKNKDIPMANYRSDFLNVLHSRGFVHQISGDEALDNLMASQAFPAYIGFDCTAPSLHVGSLVQIMMLYWLQQTGHTPIVLMGGGTTRVGDPSGKDESRQLLDETTIESNKAGIKTVFEQFLTFGEGSGQARMVDNADWLMQLNYVQFLRDVGRHVSVNQMIQRDSVRLRLSREQHLSFLEFNYMILQAYDFVELYKRYGVRLQMGGSDQWGNIVSGIDLGRRLADAELFALTTPLLTTASGTKMGKTADGAIWLNEEQLAAYDYWQFWRNSEDQDVVRFLKLFTTLPLAEIARLAALQGAEVNEAKKILATEATALLHGRAAADKAAEVAQATFEEGVTSQDLPHVDIPSEEFSGEGLGLLKALVLAGFASSNGEARRHIKGQAIRLNDQVIQDERMILQKDDFSHDGQIKLSMGKKKHMLLKIEK